jgi:hypothetical protein
VGFERKCSAVFGADSDEGTAYLEGVKIVFRGTMRRTLELGGLHRETVRGEYLCLDFKSGQQARLQLGADSVKWLAAIQNPKSVVEKIGVTAGAKIAVMGNGNSELICKVEERAGAKTLWRAARNCDIVWLFIEDERGLRDFERAVRCISQSGAIWAIYPKGGKSVKESGVRQAGLSAGLVDVKVVAVSEVLTGLKFVIPMKDRK